MLCNWDYSQLAGIYLNKQVLSRILFNVGYNTKANVGQ